MVLFIYKSFILLVEPGTVKLSVVLFCHDDSVADTSEISTIDISGKPVGVLISPVAARKV